MASSYQDLGTSKALYSTAKADISADNTVGRILLNEGSGISTSGRNIPKIRDVRKQKPIDISERTVVAGKGKNVSIKEGEPETEEEHNKKKDTTEKEVFKHH